MKKTLLLGLGLFAFCFGSNSAFAQQGACGNGLQRYIIPLDISTVTTGGTAVPALSPGHAKCGGWLMTANAAGICVDQIQTAGTATGTPSTTGCVAANVPYYLVPSSNGVSVNSGSSSVSFGGQGVN